jgi:eukaryotic-like serine/threonine-protein kinase
MPSLAPGDAQEFIDRFHLLRPLGRGAQGVVYLAHDPQLDRQVAIKTLSLDAAADTFHAEQLLAAAKLASSLSHPNIVPVFEVGLHAGQPFVVFEYVEGATLADALKNDGALPMARAVILMSQILAGLARVHAAELLHGDIKPANILLGANGIPRVTDFGISRHLLAARSEQVGSGTVQYMAPECFGEGGADLRADVFALGLLFHEMLTGEPVFEPGNEYTQIYRVLNETPVAPSTRNPRIDKRLDEIVLKALQRDPAQRYTSAAEMKQDLDRFRVPAASDKAAELRESTVHSTVEFLLRRMALKSDFPALSASFGRINQLSAQTDDASLKSMSDLIMRDFALTQKLLRTVNSAAFGGGKVTKVSHALTLLGMSQLRSIVTGLMLSGGGRKGRGSAEVAAALTDAFVAAVIARNVGRMVGLQTVEELFICGMFSRLGQLLTLFYLADEHHEIVRRIEEESSDAAAASRAVLGLTFEQLGAEVARHWNFPALIVDAMRVLPRDNLGAPSSEPERMWFCAGYASELCTFAHETPPTMLEERFASHIARFAAAIPVDEAKVRALIGHSLEVASKYIAASGLNPARTTLLDGLAVLRAAPTVPPTPAPGPACNGGSDAVAVTVDPPRLPQRADTASEPSHEMQSAGWGRRLARAWRAMF